MKKKRFHWAVLWMLRREGDHPQMIWVNKLKPLPKGPLHIPCWMYARTWLSNYLWRQTEDTADTAVKDTQPHCATCISVCQVQVKGAAFEAVTVNSRHSFCSLQYFYLESATTSKRMMVFFTPLTRHSKDVVVNHHLSFAKDTLPLKTKYTSNMCDCCMSGLTFSFL